ncbi:MAG: sulfopyruvate decarboxylase subunit beta [Candidatus Jordarchaeum sp.]|uniref:sulfopyruvate decarboxylase subunit beta n=1 Tax=Candidatus Jordarchaeum sp. TaxID=2823881 RepID=UPI00404AED44
MKRIEAIKIIADKLEKELVVCNIGFPSRELYSVRDRPENFYMLGSMGLASSIGLGLALSLSIAKRVVVMDGDGSILMNLGSLVTIANQSPKNLTLIIFDNESYGSTGGQASYTAGKTDLVALAKAAGIKSVIVVDSPKKLSEAYKKSEKELTVIVAKVEKENADVPIIKISPEEIKTRFLKAVKN